MRTAIIGHRGVGKTSLLRRIETYYAHIGRKVECLDLDREIERRNHRSIATIFKDESEAGFRRLEKEMFRVIDRATAVAEHDVFVACGAGFDPEEIPTSWHALWVRRSTDEAGRIFMDRPRLDSEISPLQEFHDRSIQRTPSFAKRADEVLWIDEGLDSPDESECGFILRDLHDVGGAITLLPELFSSPTRLQTWLESRVAWGVTWFELRDDLLTAEQIELALRFLPPNRALMSFRDPSRETQTAELVLGKQLAFDWPLERGPCGLARSPRYLSLHERKEGQSLAAALARFPKENPAGCELKAALPTEDFRELKIGHEWREAFATARVFLPTSSDGRWNFYRLVTGRATNQKQSLSFFRESDGSSTDQPTLLQWLRMKRAGSTSSFSFAAILGDPVTHSRTPMEQYGFFASRGEFVASVRITEYEWREQKALEFMQALGLRHAAVTAPLKTAAYQSCGKLDEVAERLGAVNTMIWLEEQGIWSGANTDLAGIKRAMEDLRAQHPYFGPTAVWGGGGTLATTKTVFADAEFFSARTGENRIGDRVQASQFRPDTVVWGVGRGRGSDVRPPASWKPKQVIDLNYTDDSPGREYALTIQGCRYVSGLAMFRAQAEAQRSFWESV